METAELIQLVTDNHDAVVKNYQALEAKMKPLDTLDSKLSELSGRVGDVEQKVARRAGSGRAEAATSPGKTVIDSEQFKAFIENGARGQTRIKVDELKTVATIGSGATLAGPMIAPDYRQDMVMLPQRRMTIRALLAPGQTAGNSVWFPRQTARQNNAAPVAELAQKPQSDFTAELVQTPVQTIAHFMYASRQAMDDTPALQSLIDTELRYGLSFTEENQLLTGDGTGSNLLGIIPQAAAYTAAFAITDETPIDRLAMAILQSELAYIPATGIVVHPSDWAKIRLTKDGMGRYILGDPASQTQPVLWGLPVVVTPALTVNNFLVGSFAYGAQIFDRLDAEVLISSEDSNNFQVNRLTVRAEERVALAVKRPAAFVTGTFP